ncbi:NrsF family protein, partial [Brevundimonas sp.]|uniref:NrsF family protein n=1 Tax=Brevundimonas sp. TaxID=1871086 RepID=UPI0025B8CC18
RWVFWGRNFVLGAGVAARVFLVGAGRLAPTRPRTAGLALGLATGGIAATAYGLLHCGEATAAFVATWYTLGVAAAGLIGAAVGRFALRW